MITDDDPVGVFLAHHGILGMHWGQHKAKPIAAPKRAKLEAKAKKFDKQAAVVQSAIDKVRAKDAVTKHQQKRQANQIKELQQQKQLAMNNAKAKRGGHLTEGEKRLAIGATVVGGVVLARVLHQNIQSGEVVRLAQLGKAALLNKGVITFAKDAKLADRAMSAERIQKLVVAKVNPKFGAIGTKMNCRRCTFTYEMRRRGFDVQATRTTNASGQNAIGLLNALRPGEKIRPTGRIGAMSLIQKEGAFTNHGETPILDLARKFPAGGKNRVVFDEQGGPDAIFKALATQPERSRGEVGVVWRMGGGHSMAYEVIDGKPIIFDTQTGRTYKSAKDLIDHVGADGINDAGFTRLDNVPLNHNYLLRWMQNAA